MTINIFCFLVFVCGQHFSMKSFQNWFFWTKSLVKTQDVLWIIRGTVEPWFILCYQTESNWIFQPMDHTVNASRCAAAFINTVSGVKSGPWVSSLMIADTQTHIHDLSHSFQPQEEGRNQEKRELDGKRIQRKHTLVQPTWYWLTVCLWTGECVCLCACTPLRRCVGRVSVSVAANTLPHVFLKERIFSIPLSQTVMSPSGWVKKRWEDEEKKVEEKKGGWSGVYLIINLH